MQVVKYILINRYEIYFFKINSKYYIYSNITKHITKYRIDEAIYKFERATRLLEAGCYDGFIEIDLRTIKLNNYRQL